jgi:hypothetical protein
MNKTNITLNFILCPCSYSSFIYHCKWSVEHGCSSVLLKILNQGQILIKIAPFINLHQKKNECSLGSNASSHEPIVPFCCSKSCGYLVQWVVMSLRADQKNPSWLLSAEVQNCSIFSAKTCNSVQASMVCNLLVREFCSGNVTPQMEMKDLSE